MGRHRRKKPKWHDIDPSLPFDVQLRLIDAKMGRNKRKKANVTFLPKENPYDLDQPIEFTKEELTKFTRAWCLEAAIAPKGGKFQLLNILMFMTLNTLDPKGKWQRITPRRVIEILKVPDKALVLAMDYLDTLMESK